MRQLLVKIVSGVWLGVSAMSSVNADEIKAVAWPHASFSSAGDAGGGKGGLRKPGEVNRTGARLRLGGRHPA